VAGEVFNIIVKVDPKGAETGAKRVDKALRRTEERANKLRFVMVRAFAFIGGAMVVRNSIGLLADFGQSMAVVQAITRATGDQFSQLSEEAQRLGITTRFSASQAADGMIFLARAGFKVGEVMESVGDTLNLAQAGALDLGHAADIASNVLQGFRLDVSQTSRMVDVLAFTANNANTTVGQLGDGMKFVAPIAAGLGISLEETSAAMAALSDAGLQAGMAGTGLRRVLSGLEAPTGAAKELLTKAGIAVDEVRPSVVGLTQALRVLTDAGVDTGMALEIFGQRGGPAFEVLSSSIPKVVEMTEKLKGAGGEAARVAGIMDDTLKGALFAVESAYKGLVLRLGGATKSTGGLRTVLRGLAGALRFAARNVEVLATAIGALATILMVVLAKKAIALVAAKLVVMTSGVASMTTAMVVAKPVVTVLIGKLVALKTVLMTNPFVLFVTGTVAAVAALRKLTRETTKFNALMKDIEDRAELTGFAILGDQIMRTERAIKSVKKVLAVRPEDKAAVQLLARYEEKLLKLREASSAMIKVNNAVTAAKNASNKVYQDVFENLKEEARLLKLSGKEREVQSKYIEIVRELRDEGVFLTEQQKAELEVRLWNNQVLGDQAAVLEEIRGEQDAEIRRLGALNELLREGTINQEEYNKAKERLGEPSPFMERYRSMLAEITGPQERFAMDMEVLIALIDDGAISMDEFNARLREMTSIATETSNTFSVGFSRGLIQIQEELDNVGDLAETALVNAFHSAEDALVGFVRTGKFEFMGMVDSMLDDIARLLVRLLILQAVQAVTGTGAPAAAVSSLTGMSEGGPVKANKPYMVGEEGPEIFEPAGAGRIIPADQTAAMMSGGGGTAVIAAPAPEVNVNITNVSDPAEVPAAMESPAGEKVIINAIQRNRNSVRRLLG